MKRSSIILLLVIALLIGVLVSTIQDASTYASFDMAQKQAPETVTVVAQLDLDSPITFDPQTSMLTFTAIDKDGKSSTVLYNQPKPQDFERSEEITIKGRAGDGQFVAIEILMKCPSKYTEEGGVMADDEASIYTENS